MIGAVPGMPLLAEVIDRCEQCARPLYMGDMAFSYDDGPTFCWEHSPTWNDLLDHIREADESGAAVEPGRRAEVQCRIAKGDGTQRVAFPL